MRQHRNIYTSSVVKRERERVSKERQTKFLLLLHRCMLHVVDRMWILRVCVFGIDYNVVWFHVVVCVPIYVNAMKTGPRSTTLFVLEKKKLSVKRLKYNIFHLKITLSCIFDTKNRID